MDYSDEIKVQIRREYAEGEEDEISPIKKEAKIDIRGRHKDHRRRERREKIGKKKGKKVISDW